MKVLKVRLVSIINRTYPRPRTLHIGKNILVLLPVEKNATAIAINAIDLLTKPWSKGSSTVIKEFEMRSALAYSYPAIILSRLLAKTLYKDQRPSWIRDKWAGY